MTMLLVLLAKDLRRVWRNPLPALINIALPLCITAIIGFVFGGSSNHELGRIRFAFVDEDQSALSAVLQKAVAAGEFQKHLEPLPMDRETALRRINDNRLSAALIVPTNFTRDYIAGRGAAKLELIKNPAQSVQPAVLEELAGCLVAGLNTNAIAMSAKYAGPPLVGYEIAGHSGDAKADEPVAAGREKPARAGESKPKPASNLSSAFGWALLGMTAMFLIFLASNAMTDLQRELRIRTFERYRTLHERLMPFVVGKVVFTVVFLLVCSAVMLGGGGLIFGIHWNQPLALVALSFSYACCAAGIAAALVAWAPDERYGSTLNSIAGLVLGVAGGCTFPRRELPQFISDHITPLLPTHWFADTARALQDGASRQWAYVSLDLIVVGAVLILWAISIFQRRFKTGLRA
jgi:linearmycin/streptolysin S transport system permease protein